MQKIVKQILRQFIKSLKSFFFLYSNFHTKTCWFEIRVKMISVFTIDCLANEETQGKLILYCILITIFLYSITLTWTLHFYNTFQNFAIVSKLPLVSYISNHLSFWNICNFLEFLKFFHILHRIICWRKYLFFPSRFI